MVLFLGLFLLFCIWISVAIVIFSGLSLVGAISAGYFFLYYKPVILYRFIVRVGVFIAGLSRKTCIVDEDGFLFSYMERGCSSEAKPSILLIHGFTSAKEAWTLVIHHLARDLHIVAVDMPGHGQTTVNPDDAISITGQLHRLHQFVAKIGLDKRPFHIAGQSMGGAIAGCYSATYPHQVALVTMVCPAMVTPVLSQFKQEVLAGKRSTLVPDCPEQMKEVLDLVLYNKTRLIKPLIAGMYEDRRPHVPYYNKLFKSLSTEENLRSLELCLPRIKVPAQVVWGEHDGVIDISGAKLLEDGLPNCRRVDILPNCGHLVNGERASCLAKRILDFQFEVRLLGYYNMVDDTSDLKCAKVNTEL